MPCWNVADPSDSRNARASEAVRKLTSQTIDALISDGTPQDRLFEAYACLRRLEAHKSEAPGALLKDLKAIVGDLARAVEEKSCPSKDSLSPEYERELTDTLFSLYIDINGGSLIF